MSDIIELLAKDRITFQLYSPAYKSYVFVSNDKKGQDNVVETHQSVEPRNTFVLEASGNSRYSLRNISSGRYLFVSNDIWSGDKVVEAHPYREERNLFRLIEEPDGTFLLNNVTTGLYLFVSNDKKGGDCVVEAHRNSSEYRNRFALKLNYNYSRWMEINTAIHDRKLKNITLPASHDSATYRFTERLTDDPSKELQETMDKVQWVKDALKSIPGIGEFINPAKWVNDCIIGAIKDVAQATTRTISDQLNDGIRCFDLRVAYDSESKQYYSYHSLLAVEFSEILSQFSTFLATRKGEIVYITLGHWNGFTDSSQHDIFNKLVKDSIGDFAYTHAAEYSNNPFNKTYNEIINQRTTGSKVILVNDKSTDAVFWPKSYSPPDNGASGTVISGYYTNTDSKRNMITTQKSQFTSNDGALPFALYLTLTPGESSTIGIVVSSLASALARLAALLWYILYLPAALLAIAAGLAVYRWKLPWKSLKQLSGQVTDDLEHILVTEFQELSIRDNQLSIIYCDFYEDTSVVDVAIRYSGGMPYITPGMRNLNGAINEKNGNLELFGVGGDGALYHCYYGNAWNPWQKGFNNQSVALTKVTSISNGSNKNFELFAISADKAICHCYYDGNWHPWDRGFNRQPPIEFSELFLANNGHNRDLELFAVGADEKLYHAWFNGEWQPWVAGFNAQPKVGFVSGLAINNEQNHNLEVFAIGTDSTLYHCHFDKSQQWQPWTARFNEQPAANFNKIFAINNKHNHNLELFAIDDEHCLYHCSCNDYWRSWVGNFNDQPIGFASVFAVNNGLNHNLELLAIGTDDALYHCYFDDGNQWQPWQKDFNRAPSFNEIYGISNNNGDVELYGVADDLILYHCYCDGPWHPWIG